MTICGVSVPGAIVKTLVTGGGITAVCGVGKECLVAYCRVPRAAGVFVQRLIAAGRVIAPSVFVKRAAASGSVEAAGRVKVKCVVATRDIAAAGGVLKERLIAARCVVAAS